MNTPRNIIAIDRCRADQLIGLRAVDASHVVISEQTPWTPIPIQIPARMTLSEKVESGVRLYSTQLQFRTCGDPRDHGRWVYRCKTADGRHLLVGTDGRPFPVSSVTTNHPDNMTDSQLHEVSVTFTSARKTPEIL